ncbi:hypothetical protein BB559_005173 [Furculomyces boomerangus]|uniref:Uncharacterized protein n=1 Tax=Furculomyces boomerangus TaxID=61424 RepID=A0A2T9YAA5_9FUNG|nr:hypothetical protein BB559_005173 [Furculomyces boomerangus]
MKNISKVNKNVLFLWRILTNANFSSLVTWQKFHLVSGGVDVVLSANSFLKSNINSDFTPITPALNSQKDSSKRFYYKVVFFDTNDLITRLYPFINKTGLQWAQPWSSQECIASMFKNLGFQVDQIQPNTMTIFHHLFQPFTPNLIFFIGKHESGISEYNRSAYSILNNFRKSMFLEINFPIAENAKSETDPRIVETTLEFTKIIDD